MARKTKDNPTNMAQDDIAGELRHASSQLEGAQERLEVARQPIRAAKAIVKATGIDFDIFKLCHGIRHLDDDDARQKRIRKLQVAIAALLSDKVQLDLFGFMTAQVKPAVKEALQQASEDLHREEPEAAAEPQDQDLPFDPPSVPEVEEAAEDLPALMAAEEMPANAGHIANNGLAAGRLGHDADANPHPEDSVEARLWEEGRAGGIEMGPEDGQVEQIEQQEGDTSTVVEFTGTTEQKRVQAYFFGYDNATANALPALTKGRRGEIKARIEAGFADQSEGKEPRYPRPAADEQQDDQPEAAEGDGSADEAVGTEEPGEGAESAGRVEVRDIDGKPKLFDLLANSPLMDVSSQRTGEAWAAQINEFFVDRLEAVTRDELIDAAKTLARGRMLATPTAPAAYDLRSAV